MKKSSVALCIIILIAWTWVLWLWLRYGLLPPTELTALMLTDLEFLGPYALILDLLVMVALFSVITPYLRRSSKATEDSCEDEPLDNRNNN